MGHALRLFLGRNIEWEKGQKLGNPTCLINSKKLV